MSCGNVRTPLSPQDDQVDDQPSCKEYHCHAVAHESSSEVSSGFVPPGELFYPIEALRANLDLLLYVAYNVVITELDPAMHG